MEQQLTSDCNCLQVNRESSDLQKYKLMCMKHLYFTQYDCQVFIFCALSEVTLMIVITNLFSCDILSSNF